MQGFFHIIIFLKSWHERRFNDVTVPASVSEEAAACVSEKELRP